MTIGPARNVLAICGTLPAVFTFIACSNSVLSQCSHTQFTVATVEEHFRLQATNGIPFSYPILELQSESRDGHFGTLLTSKDNKPECRTVNVTYRINNKTPEGSVVFVDYDMPSFWQKFLAPNQSRPPPPKLIPAVKKLEGPFLLVDPELAKLPPGATFDPSGLWVVNGTLAVEIAKDEKFDRREIWKIERIKPESLALPVHPAIFTASSRKWKSSKGNLLFEGIFLDRDPQKKSVQIHAADGSVSEIPFFELNLSDRKWIMEEVSARESKDKNGSTGYGFGGEGGSLTMQRSGKDRRK